MPNDIELIITNEGDNGILFEGTKGRFFVNRGKIVGKPVEDLRRTTRCRKERSKRSMVERSARTIPRISSKP